MPTYEVYNVETGRVFSTTDDLAEVVSPLPKGLAVREAVEPAPVTEETPAPEPEVREAVEPTEAPGPDADGQATPSD